jgi:hypothetical protein
VGLAAHCLSQGPSPTPSPRPNTHLEDGRLGVGVDCHDGLRVLDARHVLDRAADAECDVEIRGHDLAGLADLRGGLGAGGVGAGAVSARRGAVELQQPPATARPSPPLLPRLPAAESRRRPAPAGPPPRLQVVCDEARVHRRARRADGAAEKVREALEEGEVLLALQRAAAGDDDLAAGKGWGWGWVGWCVCVCASSRAPCASEQPLAAFMRRLRAPARPNPRPPWRCRAPAARRPRAPSRPPTAAPAARPRRRRARRQAPARRAPRRRRSLRP